MSETTDVIEFRNTYGLPIYDTPTILSVEEFKLHVKLVMEEFDELAVAYHTKDLQGVFDALIDLKYVITGMGVHMGLPMDEGWKEVQASNMSKLGEDGEPLYHDGSEGPGGKVKKGPNFFEPRLDVILEAASE